MANITLLGASYTDVPAVTLPQTGGGTVTFYENGGGGGFPGYTNIKTGSVTFPSRYQTTTNVAVTTLANIGFTPTRFYIYATPDTLSNIITSLTGGTESNNVLIQESFTSFSSGNYNFYERDYIRIGGSSLAASGGRANTTWTTRTNNYLYNDGTTIYIRTASNYGLPKDGVYNWIAMA